MSPRSCRSLLLMTATVVGPLTTAGCFRPLFRLGPIFGPDFLNFDFTPAMQKMFATCVVMRQVRNLDDSYLLALPGTATTITRDDFAKEIAAAQPASNEALKHAIFGFSFDFDRLRTPTRLEHFPPEHEWQGLWSDPKTTDMLLKPPDKPDADELCLVAYYTSDVNPAGDLIRLEFATCYADPHGSSIEVRCTAAAVVPRSAVIFSEDPPQSPTESSPASKPATSSSRLPGWFVQHSSELPAARRSVPGVMVVDEDHHLGPLGNPPQRRRDPL
jgi:hypothetical protein